MTTRFAGYNEYALDIAPRGERGVLAQREAQEELYERGRRSASSNLSDQSDESLQAELERRGFVVFRGRSRR